MPCEQPDLAEPDIMFVTRKWAPATGGMETYCVKLSEALARLEPIEVIALLGRPNGMPPGAFALFGFPITVLARYLKRRKQPRVVHLGDMAIWPLAIPALLWHNTSIVLSAHGTDIVYGLRKHWRGRLYKFYLSLGARLLRRAKIIVNSHATAQAVHTAGWPAPKIVPLATDLHGICPEVTLGQQTILFAGRLIERKGCAWFIEYVLPHLPDGMKLDVIGTGWEEKEIAALDNPSVTYRGRVSADELHAAYASALCVVLPNIPVESGDFEGFGIIAPEAAAAGGIVLAARSGGLTDAVLDGETGFLLPAGDANAWLDKIAEVSRWDAAKRSSFSRRARAVAAENFNWDRVARETRAAYWKVEHA